VQTTNSNSFKFVCYEDRITDTIGLKLLILSLQRFGPLAPLICYCPTHFTAFRRWAADRSNVQIRDNDALSIRGWEVKPTILLKVLSEDAGPVVWLDSDLMFTRQTSAEFFYFKPDALLTTQENTAVFGWNADRATLMGMKSVRRLAGPVNSCVIGVTTVHRSLLEAWADRMKRRDFQDAQKLSYFDRPLHLMSDQDVLDALLCSELFAHIPVRQFRAGYDVAQCWSHAGFAARHRLLAMIRGFPPLVHCPGTKPWRVAGGMRDTVALELSPYSYFARQYVSELDDDLRWTKPSSTLGKLLYTLSGRDSVIAGLLLQLLVDVYRPFVLLRKLLKHHRGEVAPGTGKIGTGEQRSDD